MNVKRVILWGVCCLVPLGGLKAQENGIINNSKSPYVKFKSVNMGDCQWTSGFWADKFKLCEETMVPYMGEVLKGKVGHALDNFKVAAGMEEGKHEGMFWHDGDFYKWMEAATYVYAVNKDEKILAELDKLIAIIGKAQNWDGYLSTQIQLNDQVDPLTNRKYHEMYNAGHLMTAACIHHRITGKDNFLNIAIKNADYLYHEFSSNPKRLRRFGFNQTQIMGLVELYRTVGDKRYLDLAELFIDNRGKSPVEIDGTVRDNFIGDMVQERTPLREETEAVGHAVLALYYYAGATDVYAETGEQALIEALDRLWNSVTEKKMYITGACGQTHHGMSSHQDAIHEGFIDDYMMPNLTAYNETCANICNAMFSYRMLGIHGEAKYADIMELVMFNSALSGISVDGKNYFYANPLRMINGARDYKSTESAVREPYLDCFCCPPNLVRTIAKLSGWAYSLTENGLAVNMYGGNHLKTQLLNGEEIELNQESQYPWDGAVKITVEKCQKKPFAIALRIPGWAEGSTITINGEKYSTPIVADTYVQLERKWKKGDVIDFVMPMEVKREEGHPRIEEVRNQVAIQRGPVIYCAETPDLPQGTSILDVYLPYSSQLTPEYKQNLLGGLTVVKGDVRIRLDNKSTRMYHSLVKPQWKTATIQFVPYYSWCNRGKSEMTVWFPVIWD